MGLWTKWFGEWIVIKSEGCDYTISSPLFGSRELPGTLKLEENSKTQEQRAVIEGVTGIRRTVSLAYALNLFKELERK